MAGTITHEWNGTVLTITSDSGTSSADLKGDDGARGAQGATLVRSVNGKVGNVVLTAADFGINGGSAAIDGEFADAIKPEEKSNLVYITDAASRPVEVISDIKPKQDGAGTPSPDNIRPISGWETIKTIRCGANLLNFQEFEYEIPAFKETYQAGIFTRYSLVAHSTTYLVYKNALSYLLTENLPPNTYVFSVCYLSTDKLKGRAYLEIELDDGSIVNMYDGVSVKIEQSGKIIGFKLDTTGSYNPNTVYQFTLQLEQGNIATTHEPYKEDIYSVDLNETIYGGSYKWNTGTLTKTYEIITLTGNEDISKNESKTQYYFSHGKSNGALVNPVCSHFVGDYKGAYDGMVSNTVAVRRTRVWFYTPQFNTTADLKAYLAAQYNAGTPVTIVYQMEEPISITQFEPIQIVANYGANTIYSDCGETAIKYTADTKLYIDKKFNELSTALVAMGGI